LEKIFKSILGEKTVKGKMRPGKVWLSTEVANSPAKESWDDPWVASYSVEICIHGNDSPEILSRTYSRPYYIV